MPHAGPLKGRTRLHRGQRTNPATSQPEYTDDELEFIRAVDRWKAEKGNPFPTVCTYLEILKSLGYRK